MINTIHKILIDRKSTYSVTKGLVNSEKDIKKFIKYLKTEKKLKKATHNTYAFRYIKDNKIFEGKNDDGENGAGNIILHYLKNNNLKNVMVAVSRYYGGIKLGPDRFKDIKKSLIEFFKEEKNIEIKK